MQAVWALSNAGTPEARRLVERALGSSEASVRAAAVGAIGQNPDEHTTDKLIQLVHDQDPSVRSSALTALGQVGSDKAAQAIFAAAHSASPEERVAAIPGLTVLDDAKSGQQLAQLMRDPEPSVARTAIYSSYNGGPEVDQALSSVVNDPNAAPDLRNAAASQLRARQVELDSSTERNVAQLVGAAGGYGYGGRYEMGE
jgi:HEAT repeat protein